MPTISKLIAGVIFAATGFFAGEAYKLGLPEGVQYGFYSQINLAVGFIVGWMVMGPALGKGYTEAVGSGIRTAVTVVCWSLFLFSTVLMVRKAFRKLYDDPLEAIVDIFALALDQGLLLFTVPVIISLLVGGMIGGLVAEAARQRWD
jgi:hypothetical protein